MHHHTALKENSNINFNQWYPIQKYHASNLITTLKDSTNSSNHALIKKL